MRTDDLICMMAKSPPCSCVKRNARIWLRVAVLFAAFLTIVAGLLGFRADLAAMPHNPAMMFKYAFLAAVMVGSGIAWWYSGHPGRTYRISFYGLIFLGTFLACAGLHSAYTQSWAEMTVNVFDYTAFFCVGFIALYAAVGSAILCCITKCMAPTNERVHAFMTALFASSLGALAYGLHCPHDDPAYLALWYGGTALVFTLIATPILKKKQSW
jgi:hypothetical protein